MSVWYQGALYRLIRVCLILCMLISSCSVCTARSWYTGQSYLFPRPLLQVSAGLTSPTWECLRRQIVDADERRYAVSILPCGQRTTDHPCIPGYFLLTCASSLRVAGDSAPDATLRDVRAEWLDLPGDTTGVVTCAPYRKSTGCLVRLCTPLTRCSEQRFWRSWWVECTLPIVQVTQTLGFRQTDISADTPRPTRIERAFSTQELPYAALDNVCRSRTGIEGIQCVLGGTYESDVCTQSHAVFCWPLSASYYGGFIIPTASATSSRVLCAPVLGLDGAWAGVLGASLDVPVVGCPGWCGRGIFFTAYGQYQHAFDTHTTRTFDLVGKPWSRYLQYRIPGSLQTVSGTQILSPCTDVSSHEYGELGIGMRAAAGSFQARVQYVLWAHRTQQLCPEPLSCNTGPCKTYTYSGYGIAGTGTDTASQSTIAYRAQSDTKPVYVWPETLSYTSAASRGGMTNGILCSIAYLGTCAGGEAGVLYESPRTNTAYAQYSWWCGVHVLF